MDREFQILPEQASTLADDVDRLYAFLWAVSGVMTILIGALILYFAIKYRRGSRADRTPAGGHFLILETVWIAVPFVVTGSTINGGATDSQSLSISATTVASGPNFWTTPRNWSGGAVPVTGDDIYLVYSTVDIL